MSAVTVLPPTRGELDQAIATLTQPRPAGVSRCDCAVSIDGWMAEVIAAALVELRQRRDHRDEVLEALDNLRGAVEHLLLTEGLL